MEYFCDCDRHLVCDPYSVENLHRMAKDLGIPRHWYHKGRLPHYDIPKEAFSRIRRKCIIVDSRTIVSIIKGDMKDMLWLSYSDSYTPCKVTWM